MKIAKLYLFIAACLFLLDAIVPHNEAWAAFPHGFIQINGSGSNACGVTYNNWCVANDGWTVFTAKNATGTCPSPDTTTGPCFITADNSTAASFNGTIAGTTLTVTSGTNPAVNQSLLINGSVVTYIKTGTGPTFTLNAAPGDQPSPIAMTSSLGNDSTCALIPPPSTTYVSTSLSSLSPTAGQPCFSQSTAFNKLRLVNPKSFAATGTYTINGGVMTVTSPTGTLYPGSIMGGGTTPATTTFTGQMSGTTTLTISSGAPYPANAESIFRANGAYVGYVVSGGGTSTPVLSASATFGPEASMTSVLSPPVITAQLSGATQGGAGTYSVYPSQANGTTAAAGTLTRITATRDWFLVRKGTTWNTFIGGGNWNANGWSQVDLNVIATYGTGARPKFITPDGTSNDCYHAQSSRGYAVAVVGFWCTNPLQDPTSPSYGTYTITADVGATLCASSTQICNTSIPAAVQANPTRYRAFATGITANALTAGGISATTASLTSAAGNATTVGTGQMQIQLTNTTVGAGISVNEYDTFIIEDNRIEYGAIGPQNSSNSAGTDIPNLRIRRNIMLNQYTANNFGGDNIFIGFSPVAGSMVVEENTSVAGGWVPATWGAYADSHSHNWYLHNYSAPIGLYSNINAYNSADNQYRDSGTAYNGLYLYQYGQLTAQTQDNPLTATYNINQNGYSIPVGTRTARVADGASGNILHIDGLVSTTVGANISNLTNPGSIPNGCSINSIRDAVSANLSCTLTTGIRGNGVQVGDIFRISSGSPFSYSVTAGGQYTDGGFYRGMSNVTIGNGSGSASTITDPSSRAQGNGEPFSFTQAIIMVGGTGYGANLSGTLTWSGGGCTVPPVLNVVTDAAGVITGVTGVANQGTCSGFPTVNPAASGNWGSYISWTAGGGLSAGSGVTAYFNYGMAALPTGVSLWNNTGSCTGTLVLNHNSGQQVCTYYALANGASYQFAATPGGTAINTSASASNITRTGSARFNFNPSFAGPIYPGTVSPNVSVGMTALMYESGLSYFAGDQGQSHVASVSADRTHVTTEDGTVLDSAASTQTTFMFGVPLPCSVNPGCYAATVGPNNIIQHAELNASAPGAGVAAAIQFTKSTSGATAVGNYIFNWSSTTANNVSDVGYPGTNTLVGGASGCATTACVLNTWNETRFPKANIEYYDASQLEAGNTFSGYIDNGSGSAGNILTITSGSPSLVVPTNVNYGVGDTVFDTTTNANVVAQYTRIVAQIDATHYLVSVSQLAGSSGSPVSMMYGSTDRFLAKAATQSHDTGWNFGYTAGGAGDYIRSQLQCGNQTTFPGSPACPAQGQTIH